MFIKCKCQHCAESIEFDHEQTGTKVQCPHCGKETKLLAPEKPFVPMPDISKKEKPKKTAFAHILEFIMEFIFMAIAVLLGLVGMGLVFYGCASDATSKTAFQQTVSTIQYCTGLLLIMSCLILQTLIGIKDKLK